MLTQDPACWIKGYQDGYYRRPYRVVADGLAYASGRIEGQADFSSGKPCAHPDDHNPTTDDRDTERREDPAQ